MQRLGPLLAPLAFVLALSGCGGSKVVTRTVTVGASGSTTSGQGDSSSSGAPSAGELVELLRCSGLPIGRVVSYTERSDPNHLLNRPHGYRSKANWVDKRVREVTGDMDVSDGGSIEVFTSADDARQRSDYLSSLSGKTPLVSEYDYLLNRVVLLRVSTNLVPSEARAYRTAAEAALADPNGVKGNCQQAPAPTAAKAPKPADARASAFIGGNASPPLPAGALNRIAVIALGPYGDDLPIVVRNNTSEAVVMVKVTGTASAGGRLLATGGDQGLYPDVVKPGQIAFGYVYFNGKSLPAGATFKLKATATPQAQSQFDNHVDLTVTSASRSGDSIVGYLKNRSGQPATGPISVLVECFTASGRLLSDSQAFTDQDSAAVGESVPFSVDLSNGNCPVFLVAGGGFS